MLMLWLLSVEGTLSVEEPPDVLEAFELDPCELSEPFQFSEPFELSEGLDLGESLSGLSDFSLSVWDLEASE
jgi:hypothetical protein